MIQRLASAALVAAFLVPTHGAAQDPLTRSLRGVFDTTREYVTQTADILDADTYGYRPTEEVRSAGEILAHIANAQYIFCSAAAGESSPSSENFEETRTTKPAIVEALAEAFAYCAGVFDGTTDRTGATEVQLFGAPSTRAGVLAFNTAHNFEHYGNLVTYMRLNGIVPPSSR